MATLRSRLSLSLFDRFQVSKDAGGPGVQLFLQGCIDPGESKDLATQLPEVYATLQKELNAWTPGVFADLKSIK